MVQLEAQKCTSCYTDPGNEKNHASIYHPVQLINRSYTVVAVKYYIINPDIIRLNIYPTIIISWWLFQLRTFDMRLRLVLFLIRFVVVLRSLATSRECFRSPPPLPDHG